jgi:hypothetical protein
VIFPGSRRAAGDTAVTGVATAPQVNQAGAGDSGDVGADTEPLAATRRFTQFAGRPISDFTQPLRVPENLVDLSGSGSRAARQLGDLAIELIRAGRTWSQRLLAWAAERPVAPNSVTAIALLAALCAAAWFSGGSAGDDLRGFLAVGVWALARVCARQLAVATAQRESAGTKPVTGKGAQASKRARLAISTAVGHAKPGHAKPGRTEPGRTEPGRTEPGRTEPGRTEPGRTGPGRTEPGRTGPDYAPAHTDWLVLPAFNWTPDHPEPTADRSERFFDRRWPTAPPFRRAQATSATETSTAATAAAAPTAAAPTAAAPSAPTATTATADAAVVHSATATATGADSTASAITVTGATDTASGIVPAVGGDATAQLAESVRKFAWLASVCTRAAECAIYGGMAAGAVAAGWQGTWSFAIVIVIFVCAADIAQTCSRAVAARSPMAAPAAPGPSQALPPQALPPQALPSQVPRSQARAARARLGAVLTVPAGARVLLAAFLLVAYSPRVALFAVLVITVLSLIRSIFRAARAWRETRTAAAAQASPKTVLAAATAGQGVVLACRDDGALARWTGRWLLGNLMPLPPALAGLTAILLLGWVGMRQLPGVVAFTPIVVLLLAAPGSSHPHDGRLDWLVPVVLCFGQFSFLAALGPARSVPYPIVFAACSMTAIWFAGLVAGLNYPSSPATATQPRPARPSAGPGKTGAGAAGPTPVLASRKQRIKQIIARKQPPGMHRIGWEGRVCFIAVAGMFGLTTFGYLGLSVCLAALIGRNALVHYLKPGQDRKPGQDLKPGEEQRL